MFPYEREEYQDFLLSEERELFIPKEIYWQWIPPNTQRILDLGCGKGYVSLLLARYFQEKEEKKEIYACDQKEEFLDHLYQVKAHEGYSSFYVFLMPPYSKLLFPSWLPSIDYIILSFTLSTVEDPFLFLHSLYEAPFFKKSIFLLLDWEKTSLDPLIDSLYPVKYRLSKEKALSFIEKVGFSYEEKKVSSFFYCYLLKR